ncbi:amidohydrolase family protein [Paenibacillus eucommiae]|uniref:Cytosine/adenosine deaminase-related metal-dependent hydrolase n=1 Tax=Paenibacillus eucommiae TaxID=1355755 RepID=A0ABS4IU94_9BACL|nr:amidohydrolase family protein [Paenibacillus eucommiae]MBP1991161.1 cytosine/adenosine deaminase-related metal-dependent hydrolase [Paenibacillus eucommiae]
MNDKKKADLILINGYILTIDPSRRMIENGAIAIVDGKIAAIGKNADVLKEYEGDQHDCQGGVVHPGLIDAHEHAVWHLVRGWVADTFSVREIWENYEDPLVRNISSNDEHLSMLLATMEMALNGTTFFGDTGSSRHIDGMFNGGNIVGIKGYTGAGIGDNYIPELAIMQFSTNTCLDILEKQMLDYPRTRKRPVGAHVGLAGMEHCSPDLIVGAKDLARKYGVQMQIHLAVYEEEVQYFVKEYGMTPIKLFDSLGVLDEGTALVHVIHAQEDELPILARTNPRIIHCPGASAKYGLGALSGYFPEMSEMGLAVSLGTDAGNWSDSLDMFLQMYLAAVGHRECKRKAPIFTREDVLVMGTINGAKALGVEDECGSLEVGKAADIVIHGILRPETLPAYDRVNNLIYSSHGKSVDSVLVDGEFVVKGGRITRVNIEEMEPIFNEQSRLLAGRMNYKLQRTWPLI